VIDTERLVLRRFTMDDVDEKTRNDRRYAKHGDYSIQGMMNKVKETHGGIDVLVHSVAFAPEIKSKLIDTTRAGYWMSATSVTTPSGMPNSAPSWLSAPVAPPESPSPRTAMTTR